MSDTSLVWFKRDLRTTDHEPLAEASKRGRCICLFIYEPEVMEAEDFDPSHLVFMNESLRDLRARLKTLGGDLLVRRGDAVNVLHELHQEYRFSVMYSHQETGNMVTYQRDLRVLEWSRSHGVQWTEFLQHGVFRRLHERDGWSRKWLQLMRRPIVKEPAAVHSVPIANEGPILSEGELD